MNRCNLIRPLLWLCLVAVLTPSSGWPFSLVGNHFFTSDSERNTCIYKGTSYQVGDIFTLPGMYACLKYRCNSGGVDIAEEGCKHNNVCRAVGSIFEDQCVTYSCSKSERNGMIDYQTSIVTPRCRDHYGNCHAVGSQFTIVYGNQLNNLCSCTSSGNTMLYSCGVNY